MICPFCKTKLDKDYIYCPNCKGLLITFFIKSKTFYSLDEEDLYKLIELCKENDFQWKILDTYDKYPELEGDLLEVPYKLIERKYELYEIEERKPGAPTKRPDIELKCARIFYHQAQAYKKKETFDSEEEEEWNPLMVFDRCLDAARLGYYKAEWEMGQYYRYGSYFTDFYKLRVNLEKAFYYYKRAAMHGEGYTKYSLAECYIKGEGTERDLQKGVQYLKEGASLGDIESMLTLSNFYKEGIGVEKNYEMAFKYKEKALINSKEGSNYRYLCLAGLGNYYADGIGVESNLEEALTCHRKAYETRHNIEDFNMLVKKYPQILDEVNNQGDKEIIENNKFRKWFKENNPKFLARLKGYNKRNIQKEENNTEQDNNEIAFKHKKEAVANSKKGSLDRYLSLVELGNYYAEGIGTEKDLEEAFTCYRKAYETKHKLDDLKIFVKKYPQILDGVNAQGDTEIIENNKFRKWFRDSNQEFLMTLKGYSIPNIAKEENNTEQNNNVEKKENNGWGCGCLIWILIILGIYYFMKD